MTQTTATARLEAEPVGRLLLRYSLPAVASMTLFSFYNIISSIFIGHGVGALAITGLAITFPFINLIMAVSMLVAIGGATVCSISLGAKEYDRARRVLGHNVVLSLLFGVLFAVLSLLFLEPVLYLFGASSVTLPYAREYMEIMLWCAPIGTVLIALNHLMRASGYPMRSMLISLVSVGANLALTPLFIFSFGWGMRGAAIATVLSQVLSLACLLAHYFRKNSIVRFTPGIFRLNAPLTKSMLGIGVAPFLMNTCACVVVLLINQTLRAHGGDLAIGAYGIANRLLLFFGMVIVGLTQGMQPLIGFNYGARRMDRVKRTLVYGLVVGTIITTGGFLAGQFFSEALSRMFTDHEDLIALSMNGLKICTGVFFLVGSQIVITSFFQSMGRAGVAAFLSLSRQLLFIIPGLLILPHFFGLNGVWLSLPIADSSTAVISILILWHTFRRPKVSRLE